MPPTSVCGENTVQSPGIVVWGNQTNLPAGQFGVPYSYGFGTAPGSSGTFTIGSGAPPGITIDGAGHLTGTPSGSGIYTFNVTLTNDAGAHTIPVQLLINPP